MKQSTPFQAPDLNKLARSLNRGGRFLVRFVFREDQPDIYEFVGIPDAHGLRTRYVNLAAREGANVSVLLQR